MQRKLSAAELGRRIRTARLAERAGFGLKVAVGQRWLAKRLKCSQPTICRWEQGLRAISVKDLHRVARALCVDARDLMYR